MILFATSATPSAPPQPTPTLEEFFAQFRDFAAGVVSLDPREAAIRAGLTLLVVLGVALLMWGLRVLLKALTERVAPEEEKKPPRSSSVRKWAFRVARIALLVTALIIVLRLWGFDLEILTKGPIGTVLGVGARIALIIVLSLGAIELAQVAIRNLFGRVAQRSRNIRRASQLRTLAPVLSGVATTALVLAATMMSLSEIGVEIGPLLAGAGIVGLAVGFGAQTIVKDFLTGIFLILEDAVSVGDVIRIGEFSGKVEEMSLRTIKLRDFDGTLHIFPYAEAQVIHNSTKTFSYAVIELAISYGSDVNEALSLMKGIGDDMRGEEAFAGHILAPIEIAGVDRFTDTRVVLKGRMKTAPGNQWSVMREFQRRIKQAFDAADIELAPVAAKPSPTGGEPPSG